jgi:MFS family permease
MFKKGIGLSDYNPDVQYRHEFAGYDVKDPLLSNSRQHTEEELSQKLRKPSVLGALVCGLLMLVAFLGMQSSRYLNENHPNPHFLTNSTLGWGLFFTKTCIAHLILLILVLPFAFIDCCKERTHFSVLHVIFAIFAQIFLTSMITLFSYTFSILQVPDVNPFQFNLFSLFFAFNIIILSIFCLIWFPERPVSILSGAFLQLFVILTVYYYHPTSPHFSSHHHHHHHPLTSSFLSFS